MATKVFVGGLSWDTSDETLSEHFQSVGSVVESVVIKDRDSGRSRGFGFVTFETPEEAIAAIEKINNTILDNRTISVAETRERSSNGDRGYDRRNGGGYRSGGGRGYGGQYDDNGSNWRGSGGSKPYARSTDSGFGGSGRPRYNNGGSSGGSRGYQSRRGDSGRHYGNDADGGSYGGNYQQQQQEDYY
ncbi:hypothetical protein EV182_003094 [Spiromyces aspiralis]|uniref:Uncharacterized protein n=1 Tax=Spiromyces aspiralis TaxID=68401 RepID=A0ACC1HGS3_9FUNG|nr:hypothetical protein EV182_003094 [Spiromyces aspiralis]